MVIYILIKAIRYSQQAEEAQSQGHLQKALNKIARSTEFILSIRSLNPQVYISGVYRSGECLNFVY